MLIYIKGKTIPIWYVAGVMMVYGYITISSSQQRMSEVDTVIHPLMGLTAFACIAQKEILNKSSQWWLLARPK